MRIYRDTQVSLYTHGTCCGAQNTHMLHMSYVDAIEWFELDDYNFKHTGCVRDILQESGFN